MRRSDRRGADVGGSALRGDILAPSPSQPFVPRRAERVHVFDGSRRAGAGRTGSATPAPGP